MDKIKMRAVWVVEYWADPNNYPEEMQTIEGITKDDQRAADEDPTLFFDMSDGSTLKNEITISPVIDISDKIGGHDDEV